MGDGEQGIGRRQEVRLGPRQEGKPQRFLARRAGAQVRIGGTALGGGEEGLGYPAAERERVSRGG